MILLWKRHQSFLKLSQGKALLRRNELQSININETNENGNNDINGTFIFTQNEDYYFEISSENIGKISQVCYLQIYELE